MAETVITGASDVFDNQLRSSQADANYGATTTIYIGRLSDANNVRRLVIDFDLSGIDSGDTCDSAVLELYDTDYAGRTANCAVNLYAVAAANADLVEGTEDDNPQAGSSCWNYKAYDAGSPTSWAGSAGMGTSGTDYVNTVLATGTFIDGSSGYVEFTFNSDGLDWLEGKFGESSGSWLIGFGDESTNNTVSGFYSAENGSNEPKLTINHTTPSASTNTNIAKERLIPLGVL